MSLYTRKGGKFVKLTKEQMRRFRRVDEVIELQVQARSCARMVIALAAWLNCVRKYGTMSKGDMTVTSVPNTKRMQVMASDLFMAVEKLRKV